MRESVSTAVESRSQLATQVGRASLLAPQSGQGVNPDARLLVRKKPPLASRIVRMLDKTRSGARREVTTSVVRKGSCELLRAAGKMISWQVEFSSSEGATATSAMIEVGDGVGNSAGARSGGRKVPIRVLAAWARRAPSGRRRKNLAAKRGDVRRAAGPAAPRGPDRLELADVGWAGELLSGLT